MQPPVNFPDGIAIFFSPVPSLLKVFVPDAPLFFRLLFRPEGPCCLRGRALREWFFLSFAAEERYGQRQRQRKKQIPSE